MRLFSRSGLFWGGVWMYLAIPLSLAAALCFVADILLGGGYFLDMGYGLLGLLLQLTFFYVQVYISAALVLSREDFPQMFGRFPVFAEKMINRGFAANVVFELVLLFHMLLLLAVVHEGLADGLAGVLHFCFSLSVWDSAVVPLLIIGFCYAGEIWRARRKKQV